MRHGRVLAAMMAAGALALAGCASAPQAAIEAEPLTEQRRDDPVIPIGPGGQLEVEAGEFYFELLSGVAIDGPVTVTLDNVGGALHNFRIDEAVGESNKVEAEAGDVATGDLLLFSGEYTYYCDVPGHRAAGMEGTLTVYANEEEAVPVGSGPSGDMAGTETEASVPEAVEETGTGTGSGPQTTGTDTSA